MTNGGKCESISCRPNSKKLTFKMVHVRIRGVDIEFPFQPYKCQVDYMERVIVCLQNGKNGVLESPTGTGKTLSLLCAALAWRETFVARMQLNSSVMKTVSTDFEQDVQHTLDTAVGFGITSTSHAVPKIIYASRTHSQLSQAVSELKNTSYKPKICVLGSRDQLCINNDVMNLVGSTAKVYGCKAKISSRSCNFFNNVEANIENKDFTEQLLDIEELGKTGNQHSVCPYFMSRELRNKADLIFMPYNYVLDFKSRQAHSIELNNTIILLDEAHNVEKICEDAASFELTSTDLASAQDDCTECIKILEERRSFLIEGEEEKGTDLTPEDALHLKDIFKKIENVITEPKIENGEKITKKPKFLFDALKAQKIDATTVKQIVEAIERCNMLLASQAGKPHKGKHFALQRMADILRVLFCRTGEPTDLNFEVSRFYKVVIRNEKDDKCHGNKVSFWDNDSKFNREKQGRILSYWCFHPGVAMRDITKHGIRSLILTSGTLSPLESFTSELDITFDVQLQNPHVISANQIWAGILTKGPDGEELNSSYGNRTSSKYQRSLGSLLLNLSRTTPNGLLVFFPSYPVMDSLIRFWGDSGILRSIAQNKPYFAEPRDKRELAAQMEMFYDKVDDPAYKGAIFFAVCRGKVSEGLDFANSNGRVVVVTGPPFPPRKDPKVELKVQFLDERKGRLTGKDWYRQQASRAVNQAIGRVIRHNKDYGAIFLCDLRFTYADAMQQLPIWIKPHIKTFNNFGIAQRSVILFFKNVEGLFSPPAKKTNEREASDRQADKKPLMPSLKGTANAQASTKGINGRIESGLKNYNSLAINSLAVLKADEQPSERNSVFESLSGASRKKDDGHIMKGSKTFADKILGATKDSMHDSDQRTKSKKLKIVTRRHTELSAEADANDKEKTKFSRANVKEVKEDQNAEASSGKDGKLAAKEYLIEIKKVCTSNDFKWFTTIMKSYKQTKDIKCLVESLASFFEDKLTHVHLFKRYGDFIKNNHDKELLNRTYDRLISKIAQNENNSSIPEPAAKKQKTSVESNVQEKLNEKEMMRNLVSNGHGSKKATEEFFPTLSDDDSDFDYDGSQDVLKPMCIICLDAAQAPHKAPCGHIACYKCWVCHFRNEKNCPKCKNHFRPRKLAKMYMT